MEFWDTNRSPNPGQKARPELINKKKKEIVPADYEVQIKESEKIDKYLDLKSRKSC